MTVSEPSELLGWAGTPMFWRLYIAGLLLIALCSEPSPRVQRAVTIFIFVWWGFCWAYNRLCGTFSHPESDLCRFLTRIGLRGHWSWSLEGPVVAGGAQGAISNGRSDGFES